MKSSLLRTITTQLGITFRNEHLLEEAFTHRGNARLEFLGDHVLRLAVAQYLLQKYRTEDIRKIANVLRVALSSRVCAAVAEECGLNKFLKIEREVENKMRVNAVMRSHILSGVLKALVAALYLDRGQGAVELFLEDALFAKMDRIADSTQYSDVESYLQDLIEERFGCKPQYIPLNASEAQLTNTFVMGVFLRDRLLGRGKGSNEALARYAAAEDALNREFPHEYMK